MIDSLSSPFPPVQNHLGISVINRLHGRGYAPETGSVPAVLKRCLNWLNESVGTCQQLMDPERDPGHRAAHGHIRRSIFEIRDGIVELRRELP